jgi:hypothetical protein
METAAFSRHDQYKYKLMHIVIYNHLRRGYTQKHEREDISNGVPMLSTQLSVLSFLNTHIKPHFF